MKRRITASLLVFVLLGSLLALYPTAQVPEANLVDGSPSEPADIGPSTLNYVDPGSLYVNIVNTLCFNVTVYSPDEEYVDRFEVDMPDTWAILTIWPVPANACGETEEGVDPGNVVYWQTTSPMPSDCGAWQNWDYDFCVEIIPPGCEGEPWILPWALIGDGFGGEPHEVRGGTPMMNCAPPQVDVTPHSIWASQCHSVRQEYTLNLFNYTFEDTTFNLSYPMTTQNATVQGPDQIYLGHGVDQDFIVEVRPDACLRPGTEVIFDVVAEGGSYIDRTPVTVEIRQEPHCPVCWYVYLPVMIRND